MNTAVINIKTDPKIKEEAQKTAEALGFSLSSILNAYLRQFVKTRSIEFSVNEIPNAHLQRILKKAEEDQKAGDTSPKFKAADEFITHLHKESA